MPYESNPPSIQDSFPIANPYSTRVPSTPFGCPNLYFFKGSILGPNHFFQPTLQNPNSFNQPNLQNPNSINQPIPQNTNLVSPRNGTNTDRFLADIAIHQSIFNELMKAGKFQFKTPKPFIHYNHLNTKLILLHQDYN
jgi:hypothetical protein